MPGPQRVPLRMWGRSAGQGLGPGLTVPGPWKSFIQKTLTCPPCAGPAWHWEDGALRAWCCHGWLPMKDRSGGRGKPLPPRSRLGHPLAGKHGKRFDSLTYCQNSGPFVLK